MRREQPNGAAHEAHRLVLKGPCARVIAVRLAAAMLPDAFSARKGSCGREHDVTGISNSLQPVMLPDLSSPERIGAYFGN
jgi:hypothetical protein